MEMLLTGDVIGPQQALEWGLVNRVVAVDQLDAEVEKLARQIAEKPPATVAAGKRAFYQQMDMGTEKGLRARLAGHLGELRARGGPRRHGRLHREAAAQLEVAAAGGWRAVATLYNALLTGMVVSLVARRGADTAREFVFRLFRRQHLGKFLPGLAKLGLTREPHAVACALYHYHSNALGGVKTEYVRESDRKAWVRYPPPRWMWRGTAIAAIPHEVSAAMLHGWHGHNGVTLGNPRLGFVCTGMTVDGMPGLEGYYLEHERPLAPGRARALRLRRRDDAGVRCGWRSATRCVELAR